MREERASSVRIGRLRLRVPGATPQDGRETAAAVSRRLAETLSSASDRRVGLLRVRLPVPEAASGPEMAVSVADAVARRVRGARDA